MLNLNFKSNADNASVPLQAAVELVGPSNSVSSIGVNQIIEDFANVELPCLALVLHLCLNLFPTFVLHHFHDIWGLTV
jgi:hypothetical protein